jgi:hypothetical protein
MKAASRYILFLIIGLSVLKTSVAQKAGKDDQKKADVQNLVQSKHFVFVAQSALPQSGRLINLTSICDLKVKGDTLVSDLPFFGRAYVAPIDPTDAGIQFSSTNYTYSKKDRTNGGWDILIEPKNAQDVRQMSLKISELGYASLQVTSNNRQAMSYNGYITDRK